MPGHRKVWGVAGSFFRSSPLLRWEEQLAVECCSAAYPRLRLVYWAKGLTYCLIPKIGAASVVHEGREN